MQQVSKRLKSSETRLSLLTVLLLILLVQVIQSLGSFLSARFDRRLKRPVGGRRKKRAAAGE